MSSLDPASAEPLLPLILEEIGESSDGETDPFFYLGVAEDETSTSTSTNDGDGDGNAAAARSSKFWMEAHRLSCLKRGSFQSSVGITHDDAVSNNSPDELKQRDLHLELARSAIGGNGVCACIARDGTVTNNDAKNENMHYRAAFCMRERNETKASSGLSQLSEQQIVAIARLSGLLLTGSGSSAPNNNAVAAEKSASGTHSAKNDQSAPDSGGWFRYPTNFAQKVTGGFSYAIDKVLTVYDGDEDYSGLADRAASSGEELDDASSSVKIMLAKGAVSASKISLDEEDDSAIMAGGKGGTVSAAPLRFDPALLGNADEIISIGIVVSVCQNLLAYSKKVMAIGDSEQVEGSSEFFALGSHHGEVERVMLYRNGWGAHSLGSFCKQAGRHCTTNEHETATANGKAIVVRIGKILSGVSEREVNLLASALCNSNYALAEKDIITLFPGGIPCNDFEQCQSDHALFQIHVTKLTIQTRMQPLERDAAAAKRNAVKAKKNDMTQLALVHMRRRKTALEELERCASVLTNLDASELRLERAKNDAQIVQSYKMLKTALRDVRSNSDRDIENVEELMLDIREEMEDVVGGMIGGEAIIYPEDVIDDDELNEEFKRLEMECESEELSKDEDEAQENTSAQEPDVDQSSVDPEEEVTPDASKPEAVPA